jgi:DNA-directed RNA polymerase specialized sigma24 family protein
MATREEVLDWLVTVPEVLQPLARSYTPDPATADDLVQEVVVKALRKIDRLQGLPDPKTRYRYLSGTMRRLAAELLGRKRKRWLVGLPEGDVQEPPDKRTPAQEVGPTPGLLAAIWNCVQMLPKKHREAIIGHYFNGLCETKLGEDLDPTSTKAATHHRRGRALLASALQRLRDYAFPDAQLRGAFEALLADGDPCWSPYHRDRDWRTLNRFHRVILDEEEATPGEECLVLPSLSSTLFPDWVHSARVSRVLEKLALLCDPRTLMGALTDFLNIEKSRNRHFLDRLCRFRVRHIACKETILRMVEGQWVSPDHSLCRFEAPAQLTRSEGKAVVSRALEFLTTYKRTYKIGLMDTDMRDHFTSFWKLLNEEVVLLETWHNHRDEVDFVIRNQRMVADYREQFDRLWCRLPSEGRDQRKVTAWLKKVLHGA